MAPTLRDQQRWARRGTTEQRGLGKRHQAERKRALAQFREGEPCWRCGQPMYSTQRLDLDHKVDRIFGGAGGPTALAHAYCNRSAGARLRNQMSAPPPRLCEICGTDYKPSYAYQRTCSRECGVELKRRSQPPAKQKPPTMPRKRRPRRAPSTKISYYTCRYCGHLGVDTARGTPREVCQQEVCQLARRAANNLRVRSGLTADEADAQVIAVIAQGAADDGGKWRWADIAASVAAVPQPPPRSARHSCPACGELTAGFRWCTECLCTNVNAKGRRCGNRAADGGYCEYHANEGHPLASARQW